MRVLRKMFEAVTASLFAAALVLFLALFCAAACSDRVTVRFETFGGTPIDALTAEAGEAIVPPEAPEKEGWVFLGWYLDRACEGEEVELPTVMPASSVTYYAKFVQYPAVTLDGAGGTPSQKAVYAEEGTPLLEALEGVTAEKEGLVFGAWLLDGRELTEEDVMPKDGVTVTARYKAEYSVEVRKENARGDGYDISRERFLGWEGSTVQPEAPSYAHFTLEKALSSSGPLTLRAGENTYIFTYSREPLFLRFEANAPAGSTAGGAMQELSSRYQGIQALPDCTFEAKGYTFLGWAEHPSASKFYEEGEEYALGEEDATLYAVWAKAYEDACREGGTLLVAHNAEEDGSYLALVKEPSRIEGSYDAAKNALTLGGQNGRLEHGHYLLDDSGTYTGYDLAANSVNTALGVLTLDFSAGRAVYSHGGREESGSYLYLFDEAAGKYSGHYEFYAGTTRFAFGLDREKGVFLPEGEEGGEYRLYDCAEDAFTGETLTLDGFGKAKLSGSGREGLRYRGAGGKNEWLVSLRDGSELQVLLGIREQSVGGIVFESEPVCLVFRSEFAGTFSSALGTLSLDGYGTSAVYTHSGGSVQGSYAATGSLVTLFAGEQTFRFVLDGSSFSLAGEGAGYFEGEKGSLFLDGAGSARLTSNGRTVTGVCTRLSSGDYTFEGEEVFRFRTEGDRYTVFDERLFGVFETLGGGLSLDGYGGGTYLSVTEGSFEVEVIRFGDVFEVYSEAFATLSKARFFVLGGTGAVIETEAAETGRYALVGTDKAAFLRLDGSGGASLLDEKGAVLASGSYTYDALTLRGTFALGLEEDFPLDYFRFRLRAGEEGAECVLFESASQGSFFGDGISLVLDGYGGGTLTYGAESVYGDVEGEGSTLRLAAGDKMYLLTLSGGSLLSAEAFTRYEGAEGVLFAGADSAFSEDGSPLPFTAAGNGEYLLGSGASAKRVLLEGGRWYVFREGLQGTAQTAEGTLTLDDFGRGSYATQAGVLSCEVVYASGRYLELEAGGERIFAALDGRGGFAVGAVKSSFRTL
ncbi:MAG TPA: InlB B-repeat-containing protein [Candidatus Gallimonas gallistercoris]|uniref:InlB B-repeat-containing protein n=1 Tax=Candidatus Gallimonas gallistercoris TaxID=2838602 RepID=A0A9D2KFY4_9FIRM|nr:InlB B-repeat-containing protein [Candidatus Gallimonas gallistercoris]